MTDALPGSPSQTRPWRWAAWKQPVVSGCTRPAAYVEACSNRALRGPLPTSLTSVEVAQRKRPPERLPGQAKLFFLVSHSMPTRRRPMICATMSYLLAEPL